MGATFVEINLREKFKASILLNISMYRKFYITGIQPIILLTKKLDNNFIYFIHL